MSDWPGILPLAGAAASILVAATLRGLTGFGFAIAAVPLLSLVMMPIRAVPLAICLQGIAGLIDVPKAWRSCDRASLGWLIAGGLVGTPIGILALRMVPEAYGRLGIATLAIAAVGVLAAGVTLPPNPRPGASVAVGALSGICNGLAAMPGVVVIGYYMALPLSREARRASMMVFFVAVALVGLLSAVSLGLIDREILLMTAIALPVMVAGTRLGQRLFHIGPERWHRLAAYACLVGSAAAAGAKGVAELLG